MPPVLSDWDDRVWRWCSEYESVRGKSDISEINLDLAVFLFDHVLERVVLAYAISSKQLMKRDASRIRGFPNVNAGVQQVMGDAAFMADKGHFLGHASGGILDINLFPQRRELNRGWSDEGKRFRGMERFVAANPGTFFFHRPIYDDASWIPAELEYGILRNDIEWWMDRFKNK